MSKKKRTLPPVVPPDQRDEQARRRNEEVHRLAAEMQTAILDALPAHIALLDQQGVILTVNEAWRRLGLANEISSPDFYVGQNYMEVCDQATGAFAEDAQVAAAGIRHVLRGELREFSLVYPCHTPTEQLWYRLIVTPLRPGHLTGAVVMHVNVTDRELALAALRTSAEEQHQLTQQLTVEKLRLVAAQSVAKIGSWETDLATMAVIWSDETHRIFETDPAKFTPTHPNFLNLVHPEDRAVVARAFDESLRDTAAHSIDHRVLLANGTIKFVEERWRAFCNEHGQPVRAVGTCHDITERIQAAEQLRQAHNMARIAGRMGKIGGWSLELPSNELIWSDEVCVIHDLPPGYQPDLSDGISYYLPEHQKEVDRYVAVCAQQGTPYFFELPKRTAKGRQIWVRSTGEAVRDAAGRIVRVQGAFQDITDRKLVEQALRSSEEQLRATFEQAAVGMGHFAPEGRFLRVNRKLCEISGYTADELLRLSFTDLIVPEDLRQSNEARLAMLAGRIPSYAAERRYRKKNGDIFWVNLLVTLVSETRSEAKYFIAVAEDISLRKRTEEALQQSDSQLRLASQLAHMGAWAILIPSWQMEWSDEMFAILEVPLGDVPSLNKAFEWYLPESRTRIMAALDQCAREGTPFDLELEMHTAKGRRIWVRAVGIAALGKTGIIARLRGAFQDISDRKKSAEETRQLADRLTTTLESITDAFLTVDRDWRFTFLNSEAERLIKRTRQELLGQDIWTIFPELAGSPFEREYRRALADNETVVFEEFFAPLNAWFAVRAFPSDQGLAIYFRDITATKSAREELDRANRALLMLSSANEAVIRTQGEDQLLAEICRIAVETGGFCMAWVGYAVEDAAKSISPRAHAGMDESYFANLQVSWDVSDPYGQGPAGRVIRGGEAVVIPDVLADESLRPWWEIARTQGYRGMAVFPLKDGGHTFGFLGLFLAEIQHLPPAELHLLQELADNLAFGIVNLRHTAERRLARKEIVRQAALLDKATDAILVRDLEHRVTYWNHGAERMYGWTRAEAIGRSILDLIYPEDKTAFRAAMQELFRQGEWLGELEQRSRTGRALTIESRITLVRDDSGQPQSILSINTDITERKKLEQQFLRAQRMESIGTLAGGIAHDLNNLLAPIVMSVGLLRKYDNRENVLAIIRNIERSAQRGTELVKQVLSFARGVEGARVTILLDHIVREVESIAENTFPKNIFFEREFTKDLWLVVGDPTQLNQVLLNLCVNARDAMPNGGRLVVSTSNVVIDEQYAVMHGEVVPGRYVLLAVTDTGCGMPKEVIDRIFEPFFTTKELGKGTGLGLSTVIGIVRSHGGFVDVTSEVGKGSVFKVYLPAPADSVAAAPVAEETGAPPRGAGELILIVDDEVSILNITKQTLEAFGYRVLVAEDGAQAIGLYAQHRTEIALVLTDMMMPVMDGPALIGSLKRINPAVRIVAASGLNENNPARSAQSGVKHFLAKPYSAAAMLAMLREVLTERSSRPPL